MQSVHPSYCIVHDVPQVSSWLGTSFEERAYSGRFVGQECDAAFEAGERISCFDAGSAAETASMAGSEDNLGGTDERERLGGGGLSAVDEPSPARGSLAVVGGRGLSPKAEETRRRAARAGDP